MLKLKPFKILWEELAQFNFDDTSTFQKCVNVSEARRSAAGVLGVPFLSDAGF